MSMFREFCPQGPRKVWPDEKNGPFVKFQGSRFHDRRLLPYVNQKVHVMAFLDGSGFEVCELLPYSMVCVGGWRIRSGKLIVTDRALRPEDQHLSREPRPESPENGDSKALEDLALLLPKAGAP